MRADTPQLIGNRLALVGAIVYLLEFAIIIPTGADAPAPGKTATAIVSHYEARGAGLQVLAVGLSVVLLGRIAFTIGVRSALRNIHDGWSLTDLAVGSMLVSVLLEVASWGLFAGAGRLALTSADPAAIVALDSAGYGVSLGSTPALFVSVTLAALAMVRSGLFPRWLGWLGLVTGIVTVPASMIAGASETAPVWIRQVIGPVTFLSFVVWMVATGVILVRRKPLAGAAETMSTPG
jgi:uncharacterized protein DUF4386